MGTIIESNGEYEASEKFIYEASLKKIETKTSAIIQPKSTLKETT